MEQTVKEWVFEHPWMTFFIALFIVGALESLFGPRVIIIHRRKGGPKNNDAPPGSAV